MVHPQSTSVSLISLPQVSPHYTTFPYCAVTNLFLENSPMVHLQSTQVNRNRHCNGACTKHPWQSDLSLQWCIYTCCLHQQKKPFRTAAPASISSHQGNTAPISSLQRNTQPGDGKGVAKGGLKKVVYRTGTPKKSAANFA